MRDFKSSRVPDATSKWLRLRVKLLGGIFVALLGVVFYRAFQLQIQDQKKLRDMAQDQYVREIEIPARRGDIFDRRGVPLAQSVEVDSIWIDPSMLPDLKRASKELARVLKLDPAELQARLSRAKRFAWVKRQVKPEEVSAVKALGLPGMGFTKEPRRFYPQRELAAHVIGLSGLDGHGLEGLELAFDDELSGENAKIAGYRDAKGRKLITQGASDPLEREGASVTLTIDRQAQYLAEKALSKAVEDAKATAGTAVVMDPRTGELLALANYPRFNPNATAGTSHDVIRNRAALDTFEPGSTFKAFVVAAALEEKAIKQDELFFCEKGNFSIGRHVIHDTHPHEWLTPKGVLQVSSNICAAKIAQKLGREGLVRYYTAFGFGEKAGLALPGEGRGVVPFPKAEVALATESFGQGLTATAVQVAAAYAALANGGVRMRPYLVQRVVDPDGVVLLENKPTALGQVVSEKTAKSVISMLESVVEKEGTAPKARMADYRVAGKTGTAQKVDPVAGGYSDKRVASFVGVVPAEAPRAVIFVVIDEPKTDVYGGLVAAPAFKEIAEGLMPYWGVPPSTQLPVVTAAADKNAKLDVQPARLQGRKPASDSVQERPASVEDTVTERVAEGSVSVPDLSGKVGREAVATLLSVALEPRLSGSGRVIAQSPPPGSMVEKGTRVTLTLMARQ